MVTITQPAEGAGTVTLGESSTAATINAGESALLSVAPSENYHIASITVKYSNNTEENIEFEDPKNYADNFTPTDDGTLTVTFAIDQFTLNVKVNGRGSVASDGIMINVGGEHDFAVDVNTELTFAVQPVWGNRLSRITLNDDSVNLEDELTQQGGSWSYTTPKIIADTSLVSTGGDIDAAINEAFNLNNIAFDAAMGGITGGISRIKNPNASKYDNAISDGSQFDENGNLKPNTTYKTGEHHLEASCF